MRKRTPPRAAASGLFAAFVAATLVLSGPARANEADDERSTYVSIAGMWVKNKDSSISGATYGHTTLKTDQGHGLLVAVGNGAGGGLRGEIELGFRIADFNEVTGSPGARANYPANQSPPGGWRARDLVGWRARDIGYAGDVTTWSLMANGIYVAKRGKFRPYLGAGVGLARHNATQDRQEICRAHPVDYRECLPEFDFTKLDGSDNVLAYQGMVGIIYSGSGSTEVRAGYRYFGTGTADLDGGLKGIKASYGSHNLEAGITFRF